MIKRNIINFSDVFIICFFSNDRTCKMHRSFQHSLVYVKEGSLLLKDDDNKTQITVSPGQCVFIKKSCRVTLKKQPGVNGIYQSVVLKFSRKFLMSYYKQHYKDTLFASYKKGEEKFPNIYTISGKHPEIISLFESVAPFVENNSIPSPELLNLKLQEALLIIFSLDKSIYASLFDFAAPWKIDILQFLQDNYMYDMSLEELAGFTGRSVSTFKRDFKKISTLTPMQWLINYRLNIAHNLLQHSNKPISDICNDVGFKNLSHFSSAYKKFFGHAPSIEKTVSFDIPA